MKRMILGMSMKRKDLAAWIDNHTFPTMVALAQLYLFPYGPRVHWRKEVWEKLSKVYRLKKTNKLPDAQFILESSWGLNKHNVNNALRYAQDKEENYDVRDGATYDEFYQIVEDYFIWVADKLSQNETLDLREVKEELDSLGFDEVVVDE